MQEIERFQGLWGRNLGGYSNGCRVLWVNDVASGDGIDKMMQMDVMLLNYASRHLLCNVYFAKFKMSKLNVCRNFYFSSIRNK